MKRPLACLSIVLLSLASATLAAATGRAALKAGAFDPPAPAPELSLQGSNGGTLSLGSYRGRVVLLEFGFTNCPKVCPTTLATLASVHRHLGADAKRVQVDYVTVYQERDTPAQLRAYLRGINPGFVGGTGAPAQLAEVRKHYGVMAQRWAVGNSYTVGHSSSVFLIDRQGRLRAMMPYGALAADYVHDIRALLAE